MHLLLNPDTSYLGKQIMYSWYNSKFTFAAGTALGNNGLLPLGNKGGSKASIADGDVGMARARLKRNEVTLKHALLMYQELVSPGCLVCTPTCVHVSVEGMVVVN